MEKKVLQKKPVRLSRTVRIKSNVSSMISLGYNHHMVTLYLNGNPPWLKVFGDDQKPRVVVVTVLTSLILLLYDGLMVSYKIAPKCFFFLLSILISYLVMQILILRYQHQSCVTNIYSRPPLVLMYTRTLLKVQCTFSRVTQLI